MTAPRPRAVFLGTPSFAVPSLHALCDIADVTAVVCQPDKPAGRGLKLTAPPVKEAALALGLPVHQPTKMKDGTFAAWLREQNPDVALVVAYGRILPPEVLAVPRLGCVNVHGSILPKHRGAAPIQWAILVGDAVTGVTLMKMDEGMDTGPMLSIRQMPIGADETAGELFERLAPLGAALVREDLPRYLAGQFTPIAQDNAKATYAPMLTKEQGRIDWAKNASVVHDQVRGLHPWPGAWTTLGVRRLLVHRTTREGAPTLMAGAPGEVVSVTKDRVWVATANGAVALAEVQLEGRSRVTVRQFLASHPVQTGTMLGVELK